VIPLIKGSKSVGNLCLAPGISYPYSLKIPATDVNNEAVRPCVKPLGGSPDGDISPFVPQCIVR
jgi:hypothetical protein